MENKNAYSVEQLQFLNEFYPKFGPKYCGKILNKTSNAVSSQARRMGLKKETSLIHPSLQKINPEQFWNISTPEVAYFLGFFWADGYMVSQQRLNSCSYSLRLEIKSVDANDINPILTKMGLWSSFSRKRGDWEETTTINTNSKDIFEFLERNDYLEKSTKEPSKILDQIPSKLKPYFWRGFFDGDGCISFAPNISQRYKSINFGSTFEYQWTELSKLLKEIGVDNFNIFKYVSPKGHKSSKLSIFRINHIHKFIDYLPKDFGLNRKTSKMDLFSKRFPKN